MRADAAKNIQALITTAKDLFTEQGLDVPLDEISRRAGVGNATLYRNFPTRADLIVAVYADEVTDLCRHGSALLESDTSPDGLFTWLDSFVTHITTKRPLAFAATEDNTERRTELFETWHTSIRTVATDLYNRALEVGAVTPAISVDELLALTYSAAIAATDPEHARRLLHLMRHGFAGTTTSANSGSPDPNT